MAACATNVTHDQSPRLARLTRAGLLLAFILVLVISVVRFAAGGRDDTFIMLWSGKTFTFANWFVNYNGAREELSSSIFASWIASIVYRLTPLHPLLLFKTVSLVAFILCLYIIWHRRRTIFHESFPDFLVPMVILSIGLSPMFEYWTLGGLETAFLTFFLVLTPLAHVNFYQRPSMANGILFSLSLVLLALVRTEGFIYVLSSLTLVLIVRDQRAFFSSMSSMLASVLLILGLFSVRIFFTGAMWPNPTYAKISGLLDQLGNGYSYLLGYYATGGAAAWLQGIGTLYACWSLFHYGLIRKKTKDLTAAELITIAFSSYVLLHEAFVVLSGGNWMEYYRFIVPTLPLKIILLVNFLTLLSDQLVLRKKLPSTTNLLAISLFSICAAVAAQHAYSPRIKCVTPLLDVSFETNFFTSLEEKLITHNCSYERDRKYLLPFIKNELSKYVERVGQVRVATYQAGYFPYHVREQFSADEVYLIDTVGLANRDIARVNVKKSSVGVRDGVDIDQVLAGNAGKLSEVILMKRPNMVYVLTTTPERRETFRRLGYEVVWDRPGAIVFFKNAQ